MHIYNTCIIYLLSIERVQIISTRNWICYNKTWLEPSFQLLILTFWRCAAPTAIALTYSFLDAIELDFPFTAVYSLVTI